MRCGGTRPTKRPAPSSTATLDSPRRTISQATASWSCPGATTGGSGSMIAADLGAGGRREQPLDGQEADNALAVEHCDVVRAVEPLAGERRAHIARPVARPRARHANSDVRGGVTTHSGVGDAHRLTGSRRRRAGATLARPASTPSRTPMPGGPPEGSESAWLAATSTVRAPVHDRRHGWPTAAMTTTSTGGCCAIAASDTALPGAAASGSGPGPPTLGRRARLRVTCTASADGGSATSASPRSAPAWSCSPARSSLAPTQIIVLAASAYGGSATSASPRSAPAWSCSPARSSAGADANHRETPSYPPTATP